MEYISNIFNYVKGFFVSNNEEIIEETNNINNNIIYEQPKIEADVHYFFINTANINNASKSCIKKLSDYKNRPIKIYLLKSDTIEPLFKNILIVNNNNINSIENKLSTHRRHLHTMVDAIDSFIEYNNIKNYTIYY